MSLSNLSILSLALMSLGFTSTANASAPTNSPISQLQQWLSQPATNRTALPNETFARQPLSRVEANTALTELWRDRQRQLRIERAAEWRTKTITLAGLNMPFKWLSFKATNSPPASGHKLFISLHGGGEAAKSVNDSQWVNQFRLGQAYHPSEGIYVAPRAPTDTWNMWHQPHIDDFLARLIEDFVLFEGVDPNRVYLLGYSAGGDGVYQLAPRTPDRWAAAAMMAGHPNEASPLGLRNVPFAIQVGGNDSGFRRNEVAASWGKQLDELAAADPGAYLHFTQIYAGKGHWMDLEDRKAIPWMEKFSRTATPHRIVWFQDDAVHSSCYWLARPAEEIKTGQLLQADCVGQTITLTATNIATVEIRLNDAVLDLNRPVVIRFDKQTLHDAPLPRTIAMLAETLAEKGDTNLTYSASVRVKLPNKP